MLSMLGAIRTFRIFDRCPAEHEAVARGTILCEPHSDWFRKYNQAPRTLRAAQTDLCFVTKLFRA